MLLWNAILLALLRKSVLIIHLQHSGVEVYAFSTLNSLSKSNVNNYIVESDVEKLAQKYVSTSFLRNWGFQLYCKQKTRKS